MSQRPILRVIDGLPPEYPLPQRIAFSLVHPLTRIDVPVTAVGSVEVRREISFIISRQIKTYPWPHILITLGSDFRTRLYALTRHIVGHPLKILVGEECISEPVVREPLGTQAAFQISIYDLSDAEKLAEKIQAGWIVTRPKAVQ